MKINWGKIALVGLPLLAIAGVAYWAYTKYNTPSQKPIGPNNQPPKVPAPMQSSGGSSYPLQNGSSNAAVKQLQTALGVTADGIFGPNTLSALQSQYGISSVPSPAILSSITSGSGANARAAAQAVLDQYNGGGLDVYVNSDYFAQEVTEDSSGQMSYTGMGFQMSAGDSFDDTVYTLSGVSMLGMLIMSVASGGLQGEYLVDPSIVRLVVHQASAPAPAGYAPSSTDPSTGLTIFG